MNETKFINELSADEARSYFCRTTSYFDMELPPYFNLQPLLEFTLSEIATLDKNALRSWNPRDHEGLNYTLMFNKDGDIGWRPFELMHPVIYSKCVDLVTQEDNWRQIQGRFAKFSGGIVECCSMPVVAPDADGSAKKQQILNWWKSIEQRSLELSLEYSHVSLTDVSNCYPSIYTHAIAWALHGREKAKADRGKPLLGNEIDKLITSSREGQTNGIPQASLLSHLLAELILGYCDTYIDQKLKGTSGIVILRYRDDFRIFANSDADCAAGLKAVSECLHMFGMKLGASKTERSSNVVLGAVKQDKIDALSLTRRQTTLQKELLIIHRFCNQTPGSGATKFLIREFLDRLERRLPKTAWKIENPTVLAAILLDIAAKTPAVFPAVATTISKIMLYLETSEREDLFSLVERRTKRIPHNGYMEIWLQRIASPNYIGFLSTEAMCKLVEDETAQSLWPNEWIGKKDLRDALNKFSIIDRSILQDLPPDIQNDEFDAFWKEYG
ncbi:reverse transcriptase domain-containing protein [Cognatishimia sp.]|uniref:reverse transcriptase domain-containing protein n=1 Tax=Cognatishimia sp. TaxID=2211648 RepID=UPI00351887E7|nr:RNA-directed DNA polymerase [Cognatishimia sp.]